MICLNPRRWTLDARLSERQLAFAGADVRHHLPRLERQHLPQTRQFTPVGAKAAPGPMATAAGDREQQDDRGPHSQRRTAALYGMYSAGKRASR